MTEITANQPHPSPESSIETPRFTLDMNRAAVIEAVRDLDPSALVRFWASFQPTSEVLFPSVATGRSADDLAAVLAGSKPATILLEHDFKDPLLNGLADTLSDEEFDSMPVAAAVDGFGGEKFFIGTQESVDTLARLYQGRGTDELPADADFHRGVGEAVGYPSWAIDEFVANSHN